LNRDFVDLKNVFELIYYSHPPAANQGMAPVSNAIAHRPIELDDRLSRRGSSAVRTKVGVDRRTSMPFHRWTITRAELIRIGGRAEALFLIMISAVKAGIGLADMPTSSVPFSQATESTYISGLRS
jgi:hypothetical protein